MVRVLLIDDDLQLRSMIKEMLLQQEVEVVAEAGDGIQALAWLKQQESKPDMVICDLGMPKMDGVEFLRHLAATGFRGCVGLISGNDHHILRTAEHLGRELGLSMLGSVEKPFRIQSLAEMMKQCNKRAAMICYPDHVQLSPDELREGIKAGWVVIECQPQVSIFDRKVEGVEVLVRMQHPEYGLLPPASFIGVAESCNMMQDITEAAFRQAVAWCAQWNAQGERLSVSVNVSMDDAQMLDLPEKLAGWALEHGIDHGQLVIELTETKLVENLKLSLDVVSRLRLKGFGLSIDDFGTGHSTLNKLKNFPFTELKLDREFVEGAEQSPVTRAILESSVHLARALKLTVVAEGVDSTQDWDFVVSLGVDLVQGFFVSRPMPPAQLLAWKQQWEQG